MLSMHAVVFVYSLHNKNKNYKYNKIIQLWTISTGPKVCKVAKIKVNFTVSAIQFSLYLIVRGTLHWYKNQCWTLKCLPLCVINDAHLFFKKQINMLTCWP